MLFLVLCPECKEPVPQAKMEEHCESGHQQVRRPKEGQAERAVLGAGEESILGPGCSSWASPQPCMGQHLCKEDRVIVFLMIN